jgi:hypothetical protein
MIMPIISVWPTPNSGIECVDVVTVNVEVDDPVESDTVEVVEVECRGV